MPLKLVSAGKTVVSGLFHEYSSCGLHRQWFLGIPMIKTTAANIRKAISCQCFRVMEFLWNSHCRYCRCYEVLPNYGWGKLAWNEIILLVFLNFRQAWMRLDSRLLLQESLHCFSGLHQIILTGHTQTRSDCYLLPSLRLGRLSSWDQLLYLWIDLWRPLLHPSLNLRLGCKILLSGDIQFQITDEGIYQKQLRQARW